MEFWAPTEITGFWVHLVVLSFIYGGLLEMPGGCFFLGGFLTHHAVVWRICFRSFGGGSEAEWSIPKLRLKSGEEPNKNV